MASGARLSVGLLERDDEVATLAEVIADGAARGRLCLIEGAPGIGKTRLLDESARIAARNGATVLRARAAELEAGYAYGVARQLFEAPLRRAADEERRALLAESGGQAQWLLVPPPGDEEATEQPRVHALFWLTAALAARAPLVLLVDDAQWADAPSLRFLDHLARRFDDVPVTVIASRRGAPVPPALAALADAPSAVRLRPAPLSAAGVARLVADVLGEPDPTFAAECLRATGGVPFLVLELARALAADGVVPTAAGASRVSGIGRRPSPARRSSGSPA
jgi:predicted ATPase